MRRSLQIVDNIQFLVNVYGSDWHLADPGEKPGFGLDLMSSCQ